jgi:hypothetical protein
MKKNILIVILMAFAFWGCDDGSNLYDHEIVVNRDCTIGTENAGVEFDLDSVRCGRKSHAYFGLDGDETVLKRLALFSDGNAINTKDSLWILATDSTDMSSCEKLEFPNENGLGTFCLKKFENTKSMDLTNSHVDYFSYVTWDVFFVYSKFGSYKALCRIESSNCVLLYSCSIQYDGSYYFSKVPNIDDVERNEIGGCFY